MKQDTFVLPNDNIPSHSDKVLIVSIIGKTAYSAFSQKTKPLGRVFGGESETKDESVIEGLYDEPNQIIYLHLRGLFDTATLVRNYENLINRFTKASSEQDEPKDPPDFNTIYNEVKNSYAKAMLLLFHISHIIVISHPGSSFDLSYLQMLKAIENARQKNSNQVMDILKSITDISSEWITHRRFCTPRLVFYFETCPREIVKKGLPSIKKLEHAVEDKIYHIFRKAKILNNNSSNCLFAIPPNQEYVYINTDVDPTTDRLAHAIQSLIASCGQPSSTSGGIGGNPTIPSLEFTYAMNNSDINNEKRSFMKFLQVHTNHAFVKGFDDSIGRNTIRAHFEMPSVDTWFNVANKLYHYFCNNEDDSNIRGLSVLNIDTRFSEQRCLKVLPLALARYQENLPPHYTRAYHESRLAVAMAVFTNHARGSMFEKYSKQLIEDCTLHFENGRQLCEQPSLTGNPCTLPKHDSEKEHCSGVRYIAACECGHTQGSREDPYSVRYANHTFYTILMRDCSNCSNHLDRIDFPIFQPSTKEYRAANLFSNSTSTSTVTTTYKPSRSVDVISSDRLSDISGESDLLEPSKSGLSHNHPPSENNEIDLDLTEDADQKDKNLVRQPSTTEYLPGMLTLSSPAGLLPQFPSWSLVCLGPSSLYSHNLGLTDSQHPGFLPGSNFLLPWDVTVRSSHGKSPWPLANDNRKFNTSFAGMSRSAQKKAKSNAAPTGNTNEVTVKVFVGIEYECPRGHRFMMSSSDKVLRASSGIVKESGQKVTASDMPLFFNCPCRPNKPLVAQLMRVHVVSPKNLVFITLNPKVQPAPGAPIFVPGFDEPIKLTQSTYWILRLPYVYVADRDPFLPPLHAPPTTQPSARLIQGMWGVVNV